MLNQLSDTFLLVFAGLFPVINPPAAGFIVLSMLPHATASERAFLARIIAINSLAILLGSLIMGALVLSFFGISIPVLRADWSLRLPAGICFTNRRVTRVVRLRRRRLTRRARRRCAPWRSIP